MTEAYICDYSRTRIGSLGGSLSSVRADDLDRAVVLDGVKIIGIPNLAATVPTDASALYARNVLNFLSLSLNPKTGDFAVPRDDEIIQATLVCENGSLTTAKKT